MHYANLVIVKNDSERSLKAAVDAAMESGRGVWWDFYQIGGRWTGFFDGYDPYKDKALLEVCDLCGGTGTRTDMAVTNGCNGCDGKGTRTPWPTRWPLRTADAIPLRDLSAEHIDKAYRVVVEEWGDFGGDEYLLWKSGIGECFRKREKPPLEWIKARFADGLAVIVDNHN